MKNMTGTFNDNPSHPELGNNVHVHAPWSRTTIATVTVIAFAGTIYGVNYGFHPIVSSVTSFLFFLFLSVVWGNVASLSTITIYEKGLVHKRTPRWGEPVEQVIPWERIWRVTVTKDWSAMITPLSTSMEVSVAKGDNITIQKGLMTGGYNPSLKHLLDDMHVYLSSGKFITVNTHFGS